MVYSPFWGSRYSTIIFKYLSQTFKTLAILFRHRPNVVLVMTPPVVACVPVWIYAKLTGTQYVIDAHSGAFIDERWKSTLFLHKFFSRAAAATVVTSEYLAGIVQGWGGKTKIVTDVPVCFAAPTAVKLKPAVNMMFVSTFTRDEPLDIFLRSAALTPDVQFHVTGRLKDADPTLVAGSPQNVRYTDYLSNSEYVGLLLASDAVICLTTADHTMQRGAYEAVYLGKPVITSDFRILRDSFHIGAVYVQNTPQSIAEGVHEMKRNLSRYQTEVAALRLEKLKRWKSVEDDFSSAFGTKRSTHDVLKEYAAAEANEGLPTGR
jgi:glycosyltransferase involved in cell wall biosynthesis